MKEGRRGIWHRKDGILWNIKKRILKLYMLGNGKKSPLGNIIKAYCILYDKSIEREIDVWKFL
ncbi:MAG: hypothetical protein DRN11_02755 [Thermoplasmata archaeon]|nr:MAG: hypothetical protein DRN11_02755 [Thermoplasmata archaeon]